MRHHCQTIVQYSQLFGSMDCNGKQHGHVMTAVHMWKCTSPVSAQTHSDVVPLSAEVSPRSVPSGRIMREWHTAVDISPFLGFPAENRGILESQKAGGPAGPVVALIVHAAESCQVSVLGLASCDGQSCGQELSGVVGFREPA